MIFLTASYIPNILSINKFTLHTNGSYVTNVLFSILPTERTALSIERQIRYSFIHMYISYTDVCWKPIRVDQTNKPNVQIHSYPKHRQRQHFTIGSRLSYYGCSHNNIASYTRNRPKLTFRLVFITRTHTRTHKTIEFVCVYGNSVRLICET